MPIQIWTNPRDDLHLLAGADRLGAGIGQGLVSVGDAIGRAVERKQREGKISEQLGKLLETAYPERADEFKTWSLSEKQGFLEGEAKKAYDRKESLQMKQLLSDIDADAASRRIPGRLLAAIDAAEARQPGEFPLSGEAMAGRVAQRTGMSPGARRLIEAAHEAGTGLDKFGPLAELIGGRGQSMSVMDALTSARNPPAGFGPGNVRINPNGTASIDFSPAAAPPSTTVTPITVKGTGAPTGKGRTAEGQIVDIQVPNSEGKTLTQSEADRISAINQAETDLDTIDEMFKKMGRDWAGPVSGRVRNFVSAGQDADIAAVQQLVDGATPNLARGVFREVGVLTDKDREVFRAQLPTPYDTDAVRSVKIKQLRARLKQGREEMMSGLRKAGRDLSGFDKPAAKSANVLKAELDAARAAIKRGKDPAAVKARYKEKTGQDFPD